LKFFNDWEKSICTEKWCTFPWITLIRYTILS
jgi:hypothetical protein